MVSITHFSHEHPLTLYKQLPPGEMKLVCNGCKLRGTLSQPKDDSEMYGCEICKTFFLHKSCAELPMEIVHKSHEEHSLFLLSKQPSYYKSLRCNLCRVFPEGFSYHCYMCDFDLDIDCALEKKESLVHFRKDLSLNHPSHKLHPLMLQPKPTSFRCDACDVKDEDLSYQCSSCHYLIHRRCAMLPSRTTNHDVHTHPLSLSFGLPSQYHNFDYFCAICEEEIYPRQQHWLYYCELCRYFVHIKCMAVKKPQIVVDFKGLLIDDLPRLPMSDKSVELIHRFLLKGNSLDNTQQEISIFSHRHPLLYSNDEQLLEDAIDDGEEVLCDGCIEPIISPPYYHCAECRYFLHLPCAKMPKELLHPCHQQHPLILTSTSFYNGLWCNHCHKLSNGFFYCCTAEGCKFYSDVKCVALPDLVEHKSHNHPLSRIMPGVGKLCRCCGMQRYLSTIYGCDSCSFYLDLKCLTLPETTKSRFDSNHPITLRYPPQYYHPRPFYCYQCDDEINPNYWLYHCEECDLSFHVFCANLSWGFHHYKYGQKLKISSHLHPLRYVYEASVRSSCHGCERDISSYLAFECETCNFHLCSPCVKKIEPPLG